MSHPLSPSTMAGEKKDISFHYLNENDDLRQTIHQLRLKNAELRTELAKTKRDHQEM
jgi:hypothetical protein